MRNGSVQSVEKKQNYALVLFQLANTQTDRTDVITKAALPIQVTLCPWVLNKGGYKQAFTHVQTGQPVFTS